MNEELLDIYRKQCAHVCEIIAAGDIDRDKLFTSLGAIRGERVILLTLGIEDAVLQEISDAAKVAADEKMDELKHIPNEGTRILDGKDPRQNNQGMLRFRQFCDEMKGYVCENIGNADPGEAKRLLGKIEGARQVLLDMGEDGEVLGEIIDKSMKESNEVALSAEVPEGSHVDYL